jgi:hypothetical protein
VIAWWGWVLIWAGLVVALLAMVALFAWRLFRRFLGVLDDFFVLTEKTAVLDGVDQTHEPRPLNAVLEDSETVRARTRARMQRRADRRHSRRQARIRRAKMITTARIDLKEWPHEPR